MKLDNSTDAERYALLLELVRQYAALGKNDAALDYVAEAIKLAYLRSDSSKISQTLRITGQLYNRLWSRVDRCRYRTKDSISQPTESQR